MTPMLAQIAIQKSNFDKFLSIFGLINIRSKHMVLVQGASSKIERHDLIFRMNLKIESNT